MILNEVKRARKLIAMKRICETAPLKFSCLMLPRLTGNLKDGSALNAAGYLFYRINLLGQARAAFRASRKRNKEAKANEAKLLLKLGRPDLVVPLLEHPVGNERFMRGCALMQSGDYVAAIRDFQGTSELGGFRNIGLCQFKLGHYLEAAHNLVKSLLQGVEFDAQTYLALWTALDFLGLRDSKQARDCGFDGESTPNVSSMCAVLRASKRDGNLSALLAILRELNPSPSAMRRRRMRKSKPV